MAKQVATAKLQVKVARKKTTNVRHGVRQETHVINARVQQAAICAASAIEPRQSRGAREQEPGARDHRRQVQDEIDESKALESASAVLAARLRSSSSSTEAPSGSGFIWPVSAPITSPFGMRWGTLHPGSLSAPSATTSMSCSALMTSTIA